MLRGPLLAAFTVMGDGAEGTGPSVMAWALLLAEGMQVRPVALPDDARLPDGDAGRFAAPRRA